MSVDPVPYNARRLDDRELAERLAEIELAVFDVDGTLTDGTLGYCGTTDRILLFNTLDGHGLRALVDAKAVQVGWCTTNKAGSIRTRFEALHGTYLVQGREDKAKAIEEWGVPWNKILYMGDDLNDMVPIMKAHISVAPASAVPEILRLAHVVTKKDGGRGAAREVCDMILSAKGFGPVVNVETQTVEWKRVRWPPSSAWSR